MKRVLTKHFTMLFSLLMLCNFLSAQTTVEIATGPVLTPTYHSGPVYRSSASSAYDACRYAYLYTADELAGAGIYNGAVISKLAWNHTVAQSTLGPAIFKIYMKNSGASSYTVSTAWADLINGATLHYDQSTNIPATTGYLDFVFSSNFTYTGGSVEIMVEWDINGVTGNPTTGAFAWALNTVVDKILGTSNTTLAGTTTLSTTTNSIGSIDNTRPAIQITYTGGAQPICPQPTGLTISGVTTNSANFGWTAQGSATIWDIYLSTSATAPASTTTPTFDNITTNPFPLTGLPTGTTHYVWVRSDCDDDGTSNWSGSASFTTLISNDECATATPLSVSVDLTCTTGISGTTFGATQSTATAPTCSATGVNDDVWYSFVATSTSHIVQITGATNTTAAAVYSGACASLTQVVCGSTSSGNANVTANNLTVGQTYYVRVYTTVSTVGTTANFTICVVTPPAVPVNDDCAGASSLAISAFGSCVPRLVNTTSSTQSTPNPSCTTTGNNDDVWYVFTTTTAGDYRLSYTGLTATTGTASTVGFDLYTGTCGSLTAVSGVCNTGFGTGGTGYRYVTLAASTTYYLRLWVGAASNSGTFDVCLEQMPPLTNNDCAGAIAMPAIPANGSCATVTGTTYGATESLVGCTGTANDDVWYSFVATQEAHVIECTGVTGGPATDMVFQVFSGSCGSLTSLLCSDPTTGTVGGLTIGNTYYIRVYTYSSTLTIYADFTLCVKNAPDMTFVSSTATHPLTTAVSSGESNVQILRTSVVVVGASNPLSVTELVYNMNGTTNPSDVTEARVYYTGTSTTFNTNNQFGTAIANPNGTLTFTGSQNLTGGTSNTTNYFWLVYDVACGAPTGNLLDAECTSVTVGGTPQTPTTTAPAGTRSIVALASYSTAQAGNWDDPATWACGIPPNGVTVPVNINHAVTLNVNADINDSLIINSGGVLTVMANTLTLGDIATNDGGNEMLITNSGGGLVLGGTGRIKVNGTVKFNAGSSFDMDGGSSLDIDPNGAGGSVTTTSIYMLHILTNDVSIGGGIITIIDPHPGTSGYVFYYSATGSVITTGGTIRFGDGVSTTMGGSATNGFYLFPGSSGANRVYFYNIEVKGQPAQNRHTRNLYDLIAQNSLTIDAGCELRHADDVYIYKNFVNNGSLIGTSTTYYLYLAEHSSTGTPISSANVVSITGNGTFANNTTGATANMYNLHVDNTSGTPIAIPANMITGVGTGSVSTNLRLVNGKLNLQGNTLTLGLSATSRGTLNGTITSPAGYMYNGKFQRWIGTVTGASLYPIGTSANPRWASVNYTTAPTAGGTLAFEFKEVAPGNNGLPATDTSGASPTLGSMCPDGFWEATNGGVAGGIYNMDLGTDGMACITNIANARILKRTDASTPWELHGAHADGTGTTAKRTGIPSGFSDFGVSQGATLQTFYADLDGDGYGDPNNTILAATAPGGYVSNDDDCDDSNPNLPTTFYADTDGDSYGVAGGGTTLACSVPTGYSTNDDDCNDSNPAINPGATEVCGNGVDENCDTFTGVSDFVGDLTPSCVNPAKNIITVGSIAGGPAPFTYSKDGGTVFQANPVFNNLAPGTYVMAVKDGAGCVRTESVVVNAPMSLLGTGSALDCYDDTDGSVSVSVSAGYPSYDVEWYLGPNPVGSGFSLSGLGGGTYKAIVTDQEGCVKSATVLVTEPPKMNVKLTRTNITCFGADNGSIANLTTGGVGNYTFLWEGANSGFTSTQQSLLNLGPDVYTVTATDANGCTKTATQTVKEPKELVGSTKVTNIPCFGQNNGKIDGKASGGTGTKTFQWNTGATTATITNLAPGTYTVTITDQNSCTAVATGTVTQPASALSFTGFTTTPVGANFTVNVTGAGGVAPRKFRRETAPGSGIWSGYSGTGIFTNVPAGTYLFEISDKNKCTLVTSQVIPVPVLKPVGNDRGNQDLAQDFMLTPNPARGSVQLAFIGQMPTSGEVEVRDASGRLLKSTSLTALNSNRLSLEGLPTGVLFVTYRAEGVAPVTKRLVAVD